jgi:hypothetical protein
MNYGDMPAADRPLAGVSSGNHRVSRRQLRTGISVIELCYGAKQLLAGKIFPVAIPLQVV